MNITFIGTGNVGAALAVRLANAGHDVVLAKVREESPTLAAALQRNPKLTARPVHEAVDWAHIVVLATPFAANEALLPGLADALAGKVLIDCTNPVGPGLTHGLHSVRSGSEVVQSLVPAARVVKAFSIYGFETFEDPTFAGYDVGPALPYCGDHQDAKAIAATLIADCGFEPFDVGGLVQALALEHMTLLWIRMVRAGRVPRFAWAALRSDRAG